MMIDATGLLAYTETRHVSEDDDGMTFTGVEIAEMIGQLTSDAQDEPYGSWAFTVKVAGGRHPKPQLRAERE